MDVARYCLLVLLLVPATAFGGGLEVAGEGGTETENPLRFLVTAPPLQFGAEEYPSYELGGGYTFLFDSSGNFPFGWNAHFTKNISPSLGFVGEVGGNYQSESGADLSIITFGGGLRWSRRGGGSITPYVDGIAGLARSSISGSVLGVTLSGSTTDFTFLGGGGLDILLRPNWALRTGVEYQGIFASETLNLFRIQAGIVYRAGAAYSAPATSSSRPAPPSASRSRSSQSFTEGGAPKYEVSAEYTFLRDFDLELNFPFGWNTSIARNFNRTFGIVGEIGQVYKSEGGGDISILGFMGGLRFSRRGAGSLTPYLEVLGGFARINISGGGISVSGSDPALQGGGGIDVKVSESASIRAGVDYRAIFSEGESIQEMRVRAGVVWGFGGRTADASVTVAPTPPPPPPPTQLPPRIQQPPPTQPAPAPRQTTPPPPPTRRPPATQPTPPPPPAPTPTQPPAQRTPTPTPTPPAAPATAFDRGRALLRSGDYADAAINFMQHLRSDARSQFTVAVGLFCDRSNVEAHVVNSGNAPQLFLLSVPRQGQSCYGIYWGLYDSRQEAQSAMGGMPAGIRSSGQVVLPVSRLIR